MKSKHQYRSLIRFWLLRNRDRLLVTADRLWPFGPLVSPQRLASVGGGDFERVGVEFLGYFRKFGRMKRKARVLDIGAGAGRMALPLIEFLNNGTYDGLEVYMPYVDWCRHNISRSHPNFRFHHADLYNDVYNPGGRLEATEFRFPFDDGAFDFIIATSVFTHLLPDEIDHYLSESPAFWSLAAAP